MGGDSEYEPKDSRNITGASETGGARTPDGHFTGDPDKPGHGGEYEPRDSRNVTGTASTQDGRWTNVEGLPPRAAGDRPQPQTAEAGEEAAGEDEPVEFAPDTELLRKIREGLHDED